MNNQQLSEINFGFITAGRKPASLYKPEWFSVPYDKGVEILLQGGTLEDVAKVVSMSYLQDAHESVKHVNGLGEEMDWAKTLQTSYENMVMGKWLEKEAKRMKENEPTDTLSLYGKLGSFISNDSGGLTLLKDMDYTNFTPMIDSGWDIIDDIVGGVPKHGLILVLGETGVGKSFFLGKLTDKFLHRWVDKRGAIFTLEMPGEEYAKRTVEMYPSTKELGDRLYISGSARTIDDIILEVEQKHLDYVGIDFVDWLVKETSESAYAYVYKRCVEMARLLKIPVVLLAQPNREGVKYSKFLTKFDARYTGMAENSAWMMIGLQKTNNIDMEDGTYPTFDENHEYIIFLKLRGEWKKQRGPGAIILETSSGKKWSGKLYAGEKRLWLPGKKTEKTVGKRSV